MSKVMQGFCLCFAVEVPGESTWEKKSCLHQVWKIALGSRAIWIAVEIRWENTQTWGTGEQTAWWCWQDFVSGGDLDLQAVNSTGPLLWSSHSHGTFIQAPLHPNPGYLIHYLVLVHLMMQLVCSKYESAPLNELDCPHWAFLKT